MIPQQLLVLSKFIGKWRPLPVARITPADLHRPINRMLVSQLHLFKVDEVNHWQLDYFVRITAGRLEHLMVELYHYWNYIVKDDKLRVFVKVPRPTQPLNWRQTLRLQNWIDLLIPTLLANYLIVELRIEQATFTNSPEFLILRIVVTMLMLIMLFKVMIYLFFDNFLSFLIFFVHLF